MRELQPTTQYRKDLKRYKYKPKKLEALRTVLNFLKDGQPIPREYSPHKLLGQYKGCLECHVDDDFLLVWLDEVNNVIELVRLGTHSELFGK